MIPGEMAGPLRCPEGKPVTHRAPKNVADRGGKGKTGKVTKCVWATPEINDKPRHPDNCKCNGDYSFFAQRIRWDDGKYEIRLGYYYRACGPKRGWRYGSQMTPSSDPLEIKMLIEALQKKADWFNP